MEVAVLGCMLALLGLTLCSSQWLKLDELPPRHTDGLSGNKAISLSLRSLFSMDI